jgi:signal transduction histidine kinase
MDSAMRFDPQTDRGALRTARGRNGLDRWKLEEALAQGEASIMPLIHEKAITCTGWREAARMAADLRADPGAVSKILVRLMGDAIQATPRRGRVSIAVYQADDAVEIRICDTGLGIDPEHEELITGKPSGPRLPIGSVHALARQVGGDLQVTRRPGRGSTFRLTVPAGRTGS